MLFSRASCNAFHFHENQIDTQERKNRSLAKRIAFSRHATRRDGRTYDRQVPFGCRSLSRWSVEWCQARTVNRSFFSSTVSLRRKTSDASVAAAIECRCRGAERCFLVASTTVRHSPAPERCLRAGPRRRPARILMRAMWRFHGSSLTDRKASVDSVSHAE